MTGHSGLVTIPPCFGRVSVLSLIGEQQTTIPFLVYGEPDSPALVHELQLIPAGAAAVIGVEDRRLVVCGSFDLERMNSLDGFDIVTFDDLGLGEALVDPSLVNEATWRCLLRACSDLGVSTAQVPPDFPLEAANYLFEAGLTVEPNRLFFEDRRRVKSPRELEGIRTALAATHEAMAAVQRRLFDDGLSRGVSVEELRVLARQVLAEHDCVSHRILAIAPGVQSAIIHPEGDGTVERGAPVLVDIFPRHMGSGCWGDLARTFCLGTPPTALIELRELVEAGQALAISAVRPGVTGDELNAAVSALFESAGFKTLRSHDQEEPLEEGFAHRLGHGLGLEVHEAPSVGKSGGPLRTGDVITLEPGLYVPGFGGYRVEDVVLVTDEGPELLTSFSHELSP